MQVVFFVFFWLPNASGGGGGGGAKQDKNKYTVQRAGEKWVLLVSE